MKKILLSIFSVALVANSFAQVDRSKAPEPGPAPKIQIKDAQTFDLDNGLKVIVVENHKNPTVSFQLNVDYVPFTEGDKAGNASIAGQLLKTGTATKSKSEIDQSIDFIGANFSTSARGFYASTLKKHADKLLSVVSDVVLNPSFPQEELDKLKKNTISGLEANKTDASAISANVANVLRYGKNHPYGEIETQESIENITQESVKSFYNTYFKPNVSYLVVVGDVTVDEAKKMTKKYFGAWAKGDVPARDLPAVNNPEGVEVVFVPKEGAVQSVIKVTYPLDLKPGTENAIKASVMNSILGGGIFSGRLMQNLREDKGFTYGARSNISSDRYVGYFNAGANVRNEVTDSSVTEFLYELERMRNEPVSEKDLSLTLNSMNGAFARSLESSQTIARFALNTIKYNLPSDFYKNYLSTLSSTSIADVQGMAQKYIKDENCYVFVVGNLEVAESLKKFDSDGEITFLNAFGEEEAPVTIKPAPAGVTAQTVLNNYVKAFTKAENDKDMAKKLKKLKSLVVKSSFEVQGQKLNMNSYKAAPNKYAMVIEMSGMQVQKTKYNGTKGKVVSMQAGAKEMGEEELASMKLQAPILPEAQYDELGLKATLLGVDKVDGKEAYVLEISEDGEENPTKVYYEVESGLKVKTATVGTNPQTGENMTTVMKVGDYKEVDGYMVPHSTTIEGAMPMPMVMEAESVEVNGKIDSSMFE